MEEHNFITTTLDMNKRGVTIMMSDFLRRIAVLLCVLVAVAGGQVLETGNAMFLAVVCVIVIVWLIGMPTNEDT
jgi:hypothetical protein